NAAAAPTAAPAAAQGVIVFHSAQETPDTLQLYSMRADGSGLRRIPGTPRYAAYPRLSPDGARVAFVGNDGAGDDLYTIGLDGAGGRGRGAAAHPGQRQRPLSGLVARRQAARLLQRSRRRARPDLPGRRRRDARDPADALERARPAAGLVAGRSLGGLRLRAR